MPALILKTESIPKKRNRMQTIITNIDRVAKSLGAEGVNSGHVLKWLSLELGVSSKIDTDVRKTRTIKNYILLSAVQADKIQPKLDRFIANWILCKICENPETSLWKYDKKTIHQRCYACGKLNTIENNCKFSKYLIDKIPTSEPDPPKKYRSKKQEEEVTAPISNCLKVDGWNDNDNFELEVDDFSAIDRTMKLYESGSTTVSLTSLKTFSQQSRIYAFLRYLSELREELGNQQFLQSPARIKFLVLAFQLNSAIIKPVFQKFLKWSKKKFSMEQISSVLKNHRVFFDTLCSLDTLNCEREIFGQFQIILDRNRKSLLESSSRVFYLLYDSDIVCETVILEWYNSEVSKFITSNVDKRMKVNCKNFVNWLKTAETETDDSDSDQDDIQIENRESSHRQNISIPDKRVSEYVKKYFQYDSEDEKSESDLDISTI